MQSHKEKYYFEEFLKRTHKSEEDLRSFIREKSKDISEHYAGAIRLDGEAFENMILKDACFIFELFSRFSEEKSRQKDYILRIPWHWHAIKADLIMLENQIPFFFLEELYNFSNPRLDNFQLAASKNQGKSADACQQQRPTTIFLNLTNNFFQVTFHGTSIKHFTDLMRESMPQIKTKKSWKSQVRHLHSARKLDKAGVHFAAENGSKGKVMVSERRPWCKLIPFFHSLQLQLPKFIIDDGTGIYIRNIMALEQYLYPFKTFVSSYIYLMNELIDTEEDVDFLVEHKIIENHLGSTKEAADLVNELCKNINFVNFIYSDDCEQLNKFSERWYNTVKATIKRVYFKDLWTASTTIVALFVFIFSVSGTIKSLFFS